MNDNGIIYNALISNVLRFNNFSTIFYFDPENARERCQLENFISLTETNIPVLFWRTIRIIHLSQFLNSNVLILACFPGLYRQVYLNVLARSLQYMRQAKLLIELNMIQNAGLASRVLQYCAKNHMINANLIFRDFGQTHTLYGFEAYPNYRLRSQNLTEEFVDLYPDKTLDLRGFRLRTLPDLSEPNTIFYHDRAGKPRVLGYVWNILEEFSRKQNAQLHVSYSDIRPLSQIRILDYTRDGFVDIAASTQAITMNYLNRYHEYSYPLTISSWCTMIPLDPPTPLADMYSSLLSISTLCYLAALWMLHLLLKNRWRYHSCLQGIGWLLLATFFMCDIRSRLATMFIAPSERPLIDSFQAMYDSQRLILGYRLEYNSYDFNMRTKYASMFHLSDSFLDLLKHRNSLNTTYAYTVTRNKWEVYAMQQAHWSRPKFYFSKNLCFYQSLPFALVVPENSPLTSQLNQFVHQLRQSGLISYWISKGYYYMVQAGRIHTHDPTEPHRSPSITTQDLQYVLHVYAALILISLIVFAFELIVDFCVKRFC